MMFVAPAEREHPGAGGDVQRVGERGGALSHQVPLVEVRRVPGEDRVPCRSQCRRRGGKLARGHATDALARQAAPADEAGERGKRLRQVGSRQARHLGLGELRRGARARRAAEEDDLASFAGKQGSVWEQPLEQPAEIRRRIVADHQQHVAAIAHLGKRGRQPAGALGRGVVAEQADGGRMIEHAAGAGSEVEQRLAAGDVGAEPGEQRRAGGSEERARFVESFLRAAGHSISAEIGIGGVHALQQLRRLRAGRAGRAHRPSLDLHPQIIAAEPAETADDVFDNVLSRIRHRINHI
jgi:hypothetical protein